MNLQTEVIQKKSPGRPKKVVSEVASTVETQVQSVEAKEVELGFSRERFAASQDPDLYLSRFVIPKYKDKQVAYPSKEHALQSFRGWKILHWETGRDELREVKTMDEATCKTGTVLAWRDIRIKQVLDEDLKKRQAKANAFANEEGSATQANSFNSSLSGVARGKLSAKPLGEGEND